ncbi:phosphatase PAP2 family protein [Budvicia diplopodorum]|uniref:phosphatase PAP2 family protein n=1 Tax=Budvicia diplopodorum TaxID=1119056 RepID=UPI00135A70C9|nr:phosphatase PAP2 family protein [Budvicia diplopodorum]
MKTNNGLFRAGSCLLGWGVVGLCYHLSGRWQGAGNLQPLGPVDRWISYSPDAIWPYLSFFLIVPLAYLLCPLRRVHWLTVSMAMCALIAGCIYLIWPTTMEYPPVSGNGLSEQVLLFLISIDSPQNCFPSLHAALTLLSVAAVYQRQHWLRSVMFIVWGSVIAFSILQLRRHLFIDLLSGVALASCVGYGVYYSSQRLYSLNMARMSYD